MFYPFTWPKTPQGVFGLSEPTQTSIILIRFLIPLIRTNEGYEEKGDQYAKMQGSFICVAGRYIIINDPPRWLRIEHFTIKYLASESRKEHSFTIHSGAERVADRALIHYK